MYKDFDAKSCQISPLGGAAQSKLEKNRILKRPLVVKIENFGIKIFVHLWTIDKTPKNFENCLLNIALELFSETFHFPLLHNRDC